MCSGWRYFGAISEIAPDFWRDSAQLGGNRAKSGHAALLASPFHSEGVPPGRDFAGGPGEKTAGSACHNFPPMTYTQPHTSSQPSIEESLARWRPQLVKLATHAGQGDGAHDLNHLERVWATARQLLASLPDADKLVVMAACYLHDLVNLPKNHPDRSKASRLSAIEAVARLSELGFPDDRLAAVAHAIEAHSYSADLTAETLEAKIVQDADRIDALGAIGLARMFHVGGQLGRPLAHETDPLAQQRELDDTQFALDHIEKKLLRLPASMKTTAGSELAEARAEILIRFRDQFVAEWRAAPALSNL